MDYEYLEVQQPTPEPPQNKKRANENNDSPGPKRRYNQNTDTASFEENILKMQTDHKTSIERIGKDLVETNLQMCTALNKLTDAVLMFINK